MELVRRELEPRDLGDLIAETFRIFGRNLWPTIGITCLMALVTVPIAILISGVFTAIGLLIFWQAELHVNDGLGVLTIVIMLLAWMQTMNIVSYWLIAGGVIHATCQQHFLKPVDIKESFRFAWRRAPALVLNALIYVLVTGLLSVTCIGIPLAIYFGIKWLLAPQAIVVDRCGPIRALSRSSELVKDNWWRVFGIEIVFNLLANAVSSVGGIVPVLGSLAAMIVCYAGVAIGETLLYYDLRLRKEGFNIDIMATELGLETTSAELTPTARKDEP